LKDSKLPYSLFPGQVVAVEGMNVSGRKMVPSRIFCGATPAPTKSKASELMRLHHDLQDGQPLKLLTACGPYTTSDNLEYAPLMDLMAIIRAQKPDVVIMSGPFVHISNAETTLELDDGSKMQVTYEVFFANKFAALVEELFEKEPGMQTQFVLAPSLDDAVAEWVFPQAPLADRSPKNGKMLNLPGAEGIEVGKLGLHHVENAGREGGGPRRVHCVSNPCTLKINEVVIGITSNDTIFQMSADETNANLEPGSRLTRIAQHLLQQRSYYPLFPPPLGTNLDLKQLQHCQMPCRPDILIVPSKLTCFARAVCDSTLVVNPGHLAKGTTGGTYAVMNIYPMQREALENAGSDEVEVEHAIQDRVSIEIKRI
jgi:DNA polymerase alpha subunit B